MILQRAAMTVGEDVPGLVRNAPQLRQGTLQIFRQLLALRIRESVENRIQRLSRHGCHNEDGVHPLVIIHPEGCWDRSVLFHQPQCLGFVTRGACAFFRIQSEWQPVHEASERPLVEVAAYFQKHAVALDTYQFGHEIPESA